MFRYVDSLSSLSCYIVIFKHDMHCVLILNTYENPCTILLNISSYLTHLHSSNLLISSIKYSLKIFVPTMFTNSVLLLFNLNRFLPFLCRNLTFLKLKLSFCFAPDTAIWRQKSKNNYFNFEKYQKEKYLRCAFSILNNMKCWNG